MTNETEAPEFKPLSWEAAARLRKKRLDDSRSHPGSNWDLLEQTRILRDVIDPGVLAEEPAVAETRWTQYGYVGAFEATEEFTRYYVKKYDLWRAKYRGEEHRCPVNPEFVLNKPGVMNALYSARQFADKLGISYPVFISGMFERLHGPGLYRRAPLPNHLYPPRKTRKRKGRKKYRTRSGVPVEHKALRHGKKVRESMAVRSVLAYDWDRRYLARNYVGDPAQDRAIKALLEHKETCTTPKGRLRNALEKGRVSLDGARRFFPDAVVTAALSEVSSIPDVGEPEAGLTPYRPHCLGLYQSKKTAIECGDCAWQSKCLGLATRAEGQQYALTGYRNRRERGTWEATERQRNSRKRKREKNEASMPAPVADPLDVTSPNR